jgi:adenine-specific DNA-methyltransferase
MDTEAMTHTPDLADFTFGFNDIDVVYEIMLRQKDIHLSENLEVLSNIGARTYLYGSAYLICLETDITEELISQLAGLNPLPIKFVFRDTAFKDDIDLKDDTFRLLKSLIDRNSGANKSTYTVEFI